MYFSPQVAFFPLMLDHIDIVESSQFVEYELLIERKKIT